MLTLLLALYLLIFLRYLALEKLYIFSATRYESVKSEVEILQKQAQLSGDFVGYSKARFPSFSVFGDLGNELIAVRANSDDYAREYFEASKGKKLQFILLSQEGQMSPVPPAYIDNMKYRLIANHWSSVKSKYLGFKLGGYCPGYSYAVYRFVQ